jgi:hypothetical protein
VFVILKLFGVVAWSWVWVLSPVWIPVALVLLVAAVMFLVSIGLLVVRKFGEGG